MESRTLDRAFLVNLLLPGGGLVLVHRGWTGFIVGITFAAAANYTLAAFLLFPDDFAGWAKVLALLLTLSSYLGAQWIFRQTRRLHTNNQYLELRRRVFREVQALVNARDYQAAQQALDQLNEHARDDLVIAVRRAQILTAAQDIPVALEAWRRVAQLDIHRVYGRNVRANLTLLQDRAVRLSNMPE